jgi:hypothetical protein
MIFFRTEVLAASSGEQVFSLLRNMKEAQQEAVFSLGRTMFWHYLYAVLAIEAICRIRSFQRL